MKEDVIDVNDVLGGIRICVDNDRLNRLRDEARFDSTYHWKPDYWGEYLHSHLIQLVAEAEKIASGTLSLHEELTISFDPSWSYLVLEPLSETALRIAFRVSPQVAPPLAAPESALGYMVDRCDFCQAVSDVAHDYVDDLYRMDVDWGLQLLDQFEEALNKLDNALESCAETPPEVSIDE